MTEANVQDPAIDPPIDPPPAGDPPANDPPADPPAADASTPPAGDPPADPPADDKPAALPDNWRELAAGEDEDALKLLKRYGSLNGVVKALSEAQKTIRAGVKKPEMPDPKDEKAMAAWRKAEGIPDTPEGYKLAEPITKRLIDADKPVLANFTEFAHGKNAPPAFVEMAAEWYVDMSEKAAEAQAQADDKAKEDAEDALRDAWSRDEYKGNLTLAKRFWESSGIEGLSEARLPDGRRLGDVPGFVQFSSDQGRTAFGDVVFSSKDAESAHTNRRSEIEKIRDSDFARYENEGLDKELRTLIERDLARGKR